MGAQDHGFGLDASHERRRECQPELEKQRTINCACQESCYDKKKTKFRRSRLTTLMNAEIECRMCCVFIR